MSDKPKKESLDDIFADIEVEETIDPELDDIFADIPSDSPEPSGVGGEYESINEDEYPSLGFVDKQIDAIGGTLGGMANLGASAVGAVYDVASLPFQDEQGKQEFRDNFSRGLDTIGNVGTAITERPEIAVDMAGNAIFTGGGAALGSFFGPLGTGGGAYGGNLTWRALSDTLGISDGELGLDKDASDLFAETTGEMTGDLVTLGTARLLKGAKPTGRVRNWARKRLKMSESHNNKIENMKRIFAQDAGEIQKNILDFATETIGEDIYQGVLVEANKLGNVIPEPFTINDKISDFLLGPIRKGTKARGGGGLLTKVGKEVDDLIASSNTKISYKDVRKLSKKAFDFNASGEVAGELKEGVTTLQKPFLRKLGAKAGLDPSDIDNRFKDVKLIEKFREANRTKGGLSKPQKKMFIEAVERVKKTDALLDSVELEPLEFFETVRDVTGKSSFGKSFDAEKTKILSSFRESAKAKISEGLDEVSAAAYQRANDRYFSAAEIADWVAPGSLAEFKGMPEEQLLLLEGIRFGRDIRFGNTPKREITSDLFLAAVNSTGKASVTRRVIDAIAEGIPQKKELGDVFNLKTLSAYQTAHDRLSEHLSEGVLSSEEDISLGTQYLEALEKYIGIASSVEPGVNKDQLKAAAKMLHADPRTRTFLPPADNNPLTAGLAVINGEFLSAEDESEYRKNVRNAENLDNTQRAKIINHLNKKGTIMPFEEEDEFDIPGLDKEEIEKEEQKAMALSELKLRKSSIALVKSRTQEELLKKAS
jgi:hypothetical protein